MMTTRILEPARDARDSKKRSHVTLGQKMMMKMFVIPMLVLVASCAMQQSPPGVTGRWQVSETSEQGRVVTTLLLRPDRTCKLQSRFLDLDETQSGSGTFAVVGNELRLDLGESGTTSFQILNLTQDTFTVKKDYELTFKRQQEPKQNENR